MCDDSSVLATLRRWFGFASDEKAPSVPRSLRPPGGGKVWLVTGPSGGGKSTLLAALGRRAGRRKVIRPDRLALPDRPCALLFGFSSIDYRLSLLGRCGLAEAGAYFKTPARLSDGQRFRLRLALALHEAGDDPALLLIDEFANPLDRVTARIVARSLRRLVDRSANLAVVCATAHDDILQALNPDAVIDCDFGTFVVGC